MYKASNFIKVRNFLEKAKMNIYIVCPDAATEVQMLASIRLFFELSGANVSIFYHNESPKKSTKCFKNFGLKSIERIPDHEKNLIIFLKTSLNLSEFSKISKSDLLATFLTSIYKRSI